MLGTMEEIKAKMDGNVLSLFDFLESDGKRDMADTLESNQLDRDAIMDMLETVFPLRLLQWTPSHPARRL